MSLVRIDRNLSSRQLAIFGLIWLAFFVFMGLIARKHGSSTAAVAALWSAAVVVPVIGWIKPKFMRAVYLSMAYVTFPIGFVLSFVILAVIYYGVFTPVGLLMRLFRYDPMERNFDPKAQSYWVAREAPATIDRYFRQF